MSVKKAGKRVYERRPVLGIDFGADVIRVVELRPEGDKFAVAIVGSTQVNPGYLDGQNMDMNAAAAGRLRDLLRAKNFTTRHAVVGVPAHDSMTRILDLPPMPEEEFDSVIDFEIRHLQMLSERGGAFDYCSLQSSSPGAAPAVLVVAADDPILVTVQDIAKRAGLNLVAREPIHVAAIRAAFAQNPPAAPTLYISVAYPSVEIAIADQTGLMLYRRVDVRGSDLIVKAAGMDDMARVEQSDILAPQDVPEAFRLAQSGAKEGLDPVVVSRLGTELRRSVDYFHRQFAQLSAIQSAVLIPYDHRWEMLGPALEAELGFSVKLADITMPTVGGAKLGLDEMGQSYFFGPIGLALGSLGAGTSVLPLLDLYSTSRGEKAEQRKVSARNGSLIAAAIIGVIGLVGWFITSSGAKRVEESVAAKEQELSKINAQLAPLQEMKQAQIVMIAELSKKGIPFPRIMDDISRALDPNLGVNDITFYLNGQLRISGETPSDAALINTLNNMRAAERFRSTFVDSFDNRDGRGIRFNISSSYDLTFDMNRAAQAQTSSTTTNAAQRPASG